jgi:ABC-type branched-subunit amino acid transport system substrate-binding protein
MSHGHDGPSSRNPIINEGVKKKRAQKKYTLPVIGHFADRSVEIKNIIEAEKVTGINFTTTSSTKPFI